MDLGYGWPYVAVVQPGRLNLGDLNTHVQPGHCTQRCPMGEEKVRDGRKGCTGWLGIRDTPLSTLRWELWEGTSATLTRQLGPAG